MSEMYDKLCRDHAAVKRSILLAHFPWAEVGVARPATGHHEGAYQVHIQACGREAFCFWQAYEEPAPLIEELHIFLERPAGPVSAADLRLHQRVGIGSMACQIVSIDRSSPVPTIGLRHPDGALSTTSLNELERLPSGDMALRSHPR